MNRPQRRKLKKVGIIVNSANKIIGEDEYLNEGQRVRLNVEMIMSRPEYDRLNEKYKDFIQDHKDDTFTVEYDPKYLPNPRVVCFAEDMSDPKWLWWDGDLKIIED